MEFIDYFGAVFTAQHLLILCLGTAGGLILGALPGLSPTMAVALLIPFTFHMQPAAGLILLGAAYTATVAGGAVSAILLKIPGAPANIATVLDGHAMARGGHAAKALQLCFLSSGVGGVLGIFVLIFFTPVLARWALAFGPSHLFWVAILGITIIASLGTKSALKGLIAGGVGLWISTIGFDQIQGVERFTFTDHLTGGVNIIAALVGLFAIPQVLQMLERSGGGGEVLAMEQHSVWRAMRLVAGRVRAMSIGSVVGVIIGLIPGAGGQIAGLVAYDQTRKFSKQPDKFGKGEPDGIIAAETANNAMVGPSLVPLLTLSVPGSPTAAVLLGGLLIHGIFPGADLFELYPEVSWTFINSMLVGQLLMVVFGLLLSRIAAKVLRLPEHYLAAAVLVLAVFGTYSVQHSYSDVLVMAALGIGMYALEKYGFPAAPIVLGIVLGPIAERNFLQGRIIANAGDGMMPYFFTGALNLTLIALIVLSIASSVYFALRDRSKAASGAGDGAGGKESARFNISTLLAAGGDLLLALFAVVVAVASFTVEDPTPYLFPRLLAVFLLALTGARLLLLLRPGALAAAPPSVMRALPAMAIIIVYVALAEWLGFYAAATLAFFAVAVTGGITGGDVAAAFTRRRIIIAVVSALAATAVLYALFSLLLHVQTPRGLLF